MRQREIKVSVIIPAFNSELYLERALRSCLNQSLDKKKFEIIVKNELIT